MSSARLVLASSLFVAVSATAHVAAAAPAGDRFLEGVASAVLELEFGLTEVDVVVEDGLLQLDPSQLRGHDPEAVRPGSTACAGSRSPGSSTGAPRRSAWSRPAPRCPSRRCGSPPTTLPR